MIESVLIGDIDGVRDAQTADADVHADDDAALQWGANDTTVLIRLAPKTHKVSC